VRLPRVEKHLLLLALLLLLAILRKQPVPGEGIVSSLYRRTGLGPLLAQAGGGGGPGEEARLRAEVKALERRVAELESELRSTHETSEWLGTLDLPRKPLAIPARVFSREPDRFRRSFRIDRGSDHGVEPGMAVVSGRCLLGVVRTVDAGSATVLRADDERFATEVEIELRGTSERAPGVARGTARGNRSGMRVEFVRRASGLEPGMRAFTTDFDPRLPRGLLVGEVRDIGDVDEDQILDVTLDPAVDLWRLNLVEVLKIRP